AMGAELRRTASLEMPAEPAPRTWPARSARPLAWWRKGREPMRVPRLVFASLIVGVVALGYGLAAMAVGARPQERALLLHVGTGTGQPWVCALSVDKRDNECGMIGIVHGGNLRYQFRLTAKHGEQATLAVRADYSPLPPGGGTSTLTLAELEKLPAKEYTFRPGHTLRIDVPGLGTMRVTGQWLSAMPAIITKNPDLTPGPNELRIVSPLLIHDGRVVGDMQGGIATMNERGAGVMLFLPGQGFFVISLNPLPGAEQASVDLNRVFFTIGGKKYMMVTGTPIARAQHLWIAHSARQPGSGGQKSGFIGGFGPGQAPILP
ncbi:MAG: hypothetical protein ACLGP3_07460, partial [Acidobacteriota bacterium]